MVSFRVSFRFHLGSLRGFISVLFRVSLGFHLGVFRVSPRVS